MWGLITDREQGNVDRLKELSKKGWTNMTAAERAEWSGNPLAASDWDYGSAVNLMATGPYYSWSVDLAYKSDSIVATATVDGVYLYAVSIIGNAADYAGKTLTLSVGDMYSYGGGVPQLALYWHDDGGYEYAGASLTAGGSLTFALTENAENRAFLAMYVYVTTDVPVVTGAAVKYTEVMLEEGTERHDYVPYVAILPTPATKGAYNYSDLNRVELAVAELADLLGLDLDTKTDWGVWDKPQSDDFGRYLSNITSIREACPRTDEIPTVPASMEKFNYEAANNIERILEMAYEYVTYGNYRSGEIQSGEV